MNWLDQLRKLFNPPSAEALMVRHLEETKRELLRAYAYKEDAEAMVKKYQDRRYRLESQMRQIVEEKR